MMKNRIKTDNSGIDKGGDSGSVDSPLCPTVTPADGCRAAVTASDHDDTTTQDGTRDSRVVLYTRSECHLCEQAHAMLAELKIEFTEVDIDCAEANARNGEKSLRERFDTCVPVLEINGKIRFRGRINRLLLKRIVNAELEAK